MYVLLALLALTTGTGCSANVVLARPPKLDTGPLGPFKRCSVDYGECQDDGTYDSSRLQAARTRYFRLPDCPHGIHDITVQDSGSSDAVVLVRCAAPKQPGGALPVTAANGGTRPSQVGHDAQLP
jgi:hypothetical protein